MQQCAVRWAVYGVVGVILLAAAFDTGVWSLLFTTLTAWGVVGLLLLVGCRPTLGVTPSVGRLLDYPLIGFLLLGALSTFWVTVDQGSSHLGFIKLVDVALLALFLPRLLPSPQPYRTLFGWLVLLAGVVAAYGFIQLRLGLNTMGGRLHSVFLTPNSLAGFLAVTLPLTVAICVTTRQRLARWGYLLVAVVQAAALAATGSRGGWLATVAGMGLFSLFLVSDPASVAMLRRFVRPLAIGSVALVLTIAVVNWTNPELIGPRLVSLGHPLSAEPHRYLFWQSTIEMIKARPLLGWGIGTFGVAYPKFKSPLFEGVTQNYAHNDYLQVTAELGVVGLACLLWLITAAGWTAVCCWNRRRLTMPREGMAGAMAPDEPVILAGVVAGGTAILLHSLVDFDLYVPVIALVLALFLAYLTSLMSSLSGGNVPVEPSLSETMEAGDQPRLHLPWATTSRLLWGGGCLLLALLVARPYLAERASLAGQKLIEHGDYQGAVDRFTEAIRWHPQVAGYYEGLGFAYEHWANESRRRDLLLKAEMAFRTATEVGPYNYQHFWMLGRFYKNYVNFSTVFEQYDPLGAYHRAAALYPTKAAIRNELNSLSQGSPATKNLPPEA